MAEEHERLGLRPYRGIKPEIIANEKKECELADVILCPSMYVAKSFAVYGISLNRCLILPYASNPSLFDRQKAPTENRFKILFVGSLGVRKGVVYLLEAVQRLNDPRVECILIGRIDPMLKPLLRSYSGSFTHIPTVPHDKLVEYYTEASVFVLPTIDEGMAYVVMEALCSGTPVITTPNSGAEDVIVDGQNGYLVPIRDSEAIAAKISHLLDSPEHLSAMSAAARQSARGWTWNDYVARLIGELEQRISVKC